MISSAGHDRSRQDEEEQSSIPKQTTCEARSSSPIVSAHDIQDTQLFIVRNEVECPDK
jgi:hypothetical protein